MQLTVVDGLRGRGGLISLRARLLAGLVTLVLAGLLVADVATYEALQSFLGNRLNQQLVGAELPSAEYLMHGADGHGPDVASSAALPPGSYAELLAPDGTRLHEQTFALGGGSSSARPAIPSPLPRVGAHPSLMTVPGTGGVARYQVLVASLDNYGGSTLVLAIPLTDVDSTLRQLVVLEASIGAAVLVAMALLAALLVRVGLRPLERMGHTAAAIAAGDLSRRVAPATPRTEIGRLGLALNGMLTQIEAAFAERTTSEQRLRRFVADASHELRTPLTSIRGYAELLRGGAARSAQDAALARRRIEDEAVRMSVLVDDMLLLARLDQGRPLESEPVDLQRIARDAFADARAVAPDRALQLNAPRRVLVTGDEMRLRQVLSNLVRNALVHTPPGTPVEIGVGSRDGVAVLTVADHGAGLPDDIAGRVFEPFYRADPGRSRDKGGSGLGLSIVAAVLAAHRGTARVSQT
ncbi:MAG: HAMP domain-containing histidine kinase, partial [Candidatus Dormibacteraeota bacterium]|nr:HAMP domain-containing histidine kinase [Candidatus Dormibacteraeota bacterium]